MTDIQEFLLRQLDKVAEGVIPCPWGDVDLAHVRRHKQTVEMHEIDISECRLCGMENQNIDCTYPCDPLRLWAGYFRDEPGYQDQWAVW